MIYCALLASGSGTRIKTSKIPKQFIEVGGVPVVIRALLCLLKNNRIDIIYIVIRDNKRELINSMLEKYCKEIDISRIRMVTGAEKRIDSLINAVEAAKKDGAKNNDIFVVHDSARPFLIQRVLNDCIDALKIDVCSVSTMGINDTIHYTSDMAYLDGIIERKRSLCAQTPSAFRFKYLYDTITKLLPEEKEFFTGTTEQIINKGLKVKIVKGDQYNIKITNDIDLDIAEIISRKFDSNYL